ncbi:unnamed protein product [Ambrosiozyma monospora]|uniref:Unnamed protein product n=1 Tax=Ambrosiozyma monospora TaxID=43982 RepID=A0ACB5T5R8_AMBMO|nr:unnamed protein product [Ambrosiozyma monospora]
MIIPRENNYVVRVTERIEDLINIFMAPLYFALAGLSCNLGLLNEGMDWGYIIGIICLALFGKIVGGALMSRIMGLYWVESLAVGVLMSCKGIVEIVVLQTGLKASIISQKTFSMFIVMALITTFLTTPFTLWIYPQSYREKRDKLIKEKEDKELNKQTNQDQSPESDVIVPYKRLDFSALVLPADNLEAVSNNLILLDHISVPTGLPIHAVNVKMLTDRTADLFHASMINDDRGNSQEALNSILSILKVFCDLNSIDFTSEILYALPDSYIKTLFFSSNFSRDDLFILTLNNKDFHEKPEILEEAKEASKLNSFHSCVFINNNQVLKKNKIANDGIEGDGDADSADDSSVLSTETILNPNSFHISAITLFIANQVLTQEDLVALKIFEIMVKHQGIVSAKILVSDSNQTLEVINQETSLASDKKVQLLVFESDTLPLSAKTTKTSTANKLKKPHLVKAITNEVADSNSDQSNSKMLSFEEFFETHHSTKHSHINDLVIVSDGGHDESVSGYIQGLVDQNDKVLVVL